MPSFVLEMVPSITVEVPIHQPGKAEPDMLDVTWKLHDWDAAQARSEEIRQGKITDEQLVDEDLESHSEVLDSNGKPYTIQQLMQASYVRRPLIASWFQAQAGRAKAAAKN